MIVLVELEHEKGRTGLSWSKLKAQRVRIAFHLEDLSSHDCLLMRYERAGVDHLAALDPAAIFITGNRTDIDEYGADLEPFNEAMASLRWPMFGFCGGLQVLAQALGAPVERIGPLAPDEADPFPEMAPGMRKELGYLPVDVIAEHPLLDRLGAAPVFRQAHAWEVRRVPEGFRNYMSSPISEIQLLAHDEMPVCGTQFHPEYATLEHPAGDTMLENFLRWAGVSSPSN